MIDGKVANAACNNKAQQRCYICKALTTEFKDGKLRDIDEDALMLGLSPLHCKIRIMEHMLQMAYKLPIAKPSHLNPDEVILN